MALKKTKIFATLFISSFAILTPSILKAENTNLSLSLPIDCEPNKTCFIQNYVDIDPSDKIKDYSCNNSTYDGHKGVDIRLLSVAKAKEGVSVLASAPGVVKVIRDGMVDKLITDLNNPYIKNRQCGNGVVIDHGDGWETQYCHMQQGSLLVKKGEEIKRGQRLGNVGFSGEAQFAHIHLSVRKNGKVIDPFLGDKTNSSCSTNTKNENTLWDKKAIDSLKYQEGSLLQSGFITAPINTAIVENGELPPQPNSISAKAIVFYSRFINLRKGDKISFEITGPLGIFSSNITKPLEKNKAQYVAYSGKKRPKEGFAQGEYIAYVKLLREGKAIIYKEQTMKLK